MTSEKFKFEIGNMFIIHTYMTSEKFKFEICTCYMSNIETFITILKIQIHTF